MHGGDDQMTTLAGPESIVSKKVGGIGGGNDLCLRLNVCSQE